MKIFGFCERLPDQARAHNLAIHGDQAALRLPRKNRFREAGHHSRIQQASENCEKYGQAQSGSKFFQHDSLLIYARCSATRILSISQIPGNGTMIPPRPETSRLRVSICPALTGLYCTPRSAKGTNAMMMKALKITRAK